MKTTWNIIKSETGKKSKKGWCTYPKLWLQINKRLQIHLIITISDKSTDKRNDKTVQHLYSNYSTCTVTVQHLYSYCTAPFATSHTLITSQLMRLKNY